MEAALAAKMVRLGDCKVPRWTPERKMTHRCFLRVDRLSQAGVLHDVIAHKAAGGRISTYVVVMNVAHCLCRGLSVDKIKFVFLLIQRNV